MYSQPNMFPFPYHPLCPRMRRMRRMHPFGFPVPVPVTHPLMFAPPTTMTEGRKNPRSFYGRKVLFGNGANHHDLISFSLENDTKADTLVIRHHVKAKYFEDLELAKLKDLLEELDRIQQDRIGMWDQGPEEIEMRQMTIDTLKDVIKAKNWAADSDDDDKDDEDDEDDDADDAGSQD